MGHDHAHHHGHDQGEHASARQMLFALLLTGAFMVAEFVGGLVANSLALLADAAHMLTDTASLAMAYAAVLAASRPASSALSYGHHRWQVLAAFVNGLSLIVLAAWILLEGAERYRAPAPVAGQIVLLLGVLGLLVNLAAFRILSAGPQSLNQRGALAHVIGDMLGSVAALIAGAVILLTGWTPIDLVLSALVALLMVRTGWLIARDSGHILLEGTPPGIDLQRVTAEVLASVPEVKAVHHVHVWALTEARPVMTLHAVLAPEADGDAAVARINAVLREAANITHATIQIERAPCHGAAHEAACEPPHKH